MPDGGRGIAIYTTASLPWMTGTSINPLFRAAYLAKHVNRKVILVIPWLSSKHQKLVYPNNVTFRSPLEHEKFVRNWIEQRVHFPCAFEIRFYPGKFAVDKRSIIAVGDISEFVSDKEASVVVLEEPEHLTWFHHGQMWKNKFHLVIGIVHTNYLEYVKGENNGQLKAFLLKHVNRWLADIYCHKVIRLSGATQDYPNSTICNIHGVNPEFLKIGENVTKLQKRGRKTFTKGFYYIGKMVWNKGYRELLMLLYDHQKEFTADFSIDLYGSGEDFSEIKEAAQRLKLKVRVFPGCDHSEDLFHDYKVFLNPSTTDVLCTTTAEALAMGKFVICANHPSNRFFKQFPNCLLFSNDSEFVKAIHDVLNNDPLELTDEQRHTLSWEAATERFLKVAKLDHAFTKKARVQDFASASLNPWKNLERACSSYLHFVASGFEPTRRAFGAVPGSLKPDYELCRELGLPFPAKKLNTMQLL